MKFHSLLLSALAAAVAANPVDERRRPKVPQGGSPPGCVGTVKGKFEYAAVTVGTPDTRPPNSTCDEPDVFFPVTLKKGVIKGEDGSTLYIAQDRTFQTANPPPPDALYTGGWSFCESNRTLALGPSTILYLCPFEDDQGAFAIFTDFPVDPRCEANNLVRVPCIR